MRRTIVSLALTLITVFAHAQSPVETRKIILAVNVNESPFSCSTLLVRRSGKGLASTQRLELHVGLSSDSAKSVEVELPATGFDKAIEGLLAAASLPTTVVISGKTYNAPITVRLVLGEPTESVAFEYNGSEFFVDLIISGHLIDSHVVSAEWLKELGKNYSSAVQVVAQAK